MNEGNYSIFYGNKNVPAFFHSDLGLLSPTTPQPPTTMPSRQGKGTSVISHMYSFVSIWSLALYASHCGATST